MKLKLIFDWGGFSSVAILPTVLLGNGRNWNRRYGWCYLYWWQGRLGFSWEVKA
jgi:hypothetical protein